MSRSVFGDARNAVPESLAQTIIDGGSADSIMLRAVSKLLRNQLDGGSTFRSHPLGFIRIRLGWTADRVQLLLHCWDPYIAEPQSQSLNVHCHKFDLWSSVISGSIVDTQFAWTTKSVPGNASHRLFAASVTDEASELTPTDDLGDLTLIDQTDYARHGAYYVPVGRFHKSQPQKGCRTLTIVATAPAVMPHSLVAVPVELTTVPVFARHAAGGSTIMDAIRFVTATLEG